MAEDRRIGEQEQRNDHGPVKNRFSRNATTNAARISISAATGSDTYRARATSSGADDTEGAKKGALFLGLVVIAYIVFLVVSGQMAEFLEALRNVKVGWIIGACICFALYFVFGVAAYAVAVWLDPDSPVGIRDLMSVEASGIFFGNLTPMMAGAIPSQIYRLTRTGLDAGEAMATQFTRFIVFQASVVLFAAIMLLAEFRFFLETYGNIVFLNLVVFGMHALQLAALFVLCLCPNFVIKLGNWLIRFLTKRGWMKDYAKWNDMVNNQVAEFSDAFKRAAKHAPSMLITLVVTMAQLACMYMIPWFVLHAFGKTGDFFTCLAAGSMVQMVASAVPLPGGTGGAEGGFALFYGPMFGESIAAGYLVWRLITFIAPTILAAPILGLRSTTPESIYQRWNNFAHGAGRFKRTYRKNR
ncbi:MAG: flippase-like domain-containing protein [Atopobiaceae bacterium]|nr:flippase-like domain-containing protein [Atopobiaceae bacterium]